jgi:hypothetical protein
MYHLICIYPTFAQKRLNILGGHVLSQNEYEKLSPKTFSWLPRPNTAQSI